MATWFWDWPIGSIENQSLYSDRDGTLEKPWILGPNRLNINPGAMDPSVMSPGDTLYIRDSHTWPNFGDLLVGGNYEGIIIRGDFENRPGVISGAAISDTNNMTIMNLTFQDGGIILNNCHNIVLDTISILNSVKAISVDLAQDANNYIIRNCLIDTASREGIEIFTHPSKSRDNWLIEDNEITNVGIAQQNPEADLEGIGIQRLTNSIIRRNHIHHSDYGINIFESGNGSCHDLEIYENIIHDVTGGPSSWPSRGIFISGGATEEGSLYNIHIHHNTVYNIGKEGIRLQNPVNPVGLICNNNSIANVNTEFGTPHSQPVTNTNSGWQVYSNSYQNSPSFPVYEMIIAASNFGGVTEGDIICVREPLGYLGVKERALFLMLLIESEQTPAQLRVRLNGTPKYNKYINLEDLNSEFDLNLDLDQVRNPNIDYQPLFDIDTEIGVFLSSPTAINIDAIIQTKT